ncbi:MAG: hypothetical protein R3D26_01605 [Cyanobacteriota/Melainabacteria group bacterium]
MNGHMFIKGKKSTSDPAFGTEELQQNCRRIRSDHAQLARAWCLRLPGVLSVTRGATKLEQIDVTMRRRPSGA